MEREEERGKENKRDILLEKEGKGKGVGKREGGGRGDVYYSISNNKRGD